MTEKRKKISNKKEDRENKQSLLDALKADNFDTFYPVFNMKKHFDKSYLQKFKKIKTVF
jgi:hypothetical protein